MEEHIQGKGGLAHTGAGGQENQIGFVQARNGHIQVGQAGGQSGHRRVAGRELRQAVVDAEDHAGDVLQSLDAAALADGVDPLLGGLQHLLSGAGSLLDHGGEGAGGLRNAPEEGFVL